MTQLFVLLLLLLDCLPLGWYVALKNRGAVDFCVRAESSAEYAVQTHTSSASREVSSTGQRADKEWRSLTQRAERIRITDPVYAG